MSNKDKLSIGPFPNFGKGRVKFVEALLKAGAEGWEVPKENFNTEAMMQWGGRLRIFLVKPEEKVEEDKSSDIREGILTSQKLAKQDMLDFAASEGIEIPEDIKLPLQIRKYIKEALEAKSSEE